MNTPTPNTIPPVSGPQSIRVNRLWGRIVILFLGVVIAGPLIYFVFWPQYVRTELLKNGLEAEGVITEISPTGNYFNNQPEARIVVTVTPKEGTPFRSETRMVINPLYSPSYQPGKRVRVRYDKNDSSKMTIEYTEGA